MVKSKTRFATQSAPGNLRPVNASNYHRLALSAVFTMAATLCFATSVRGQEQAGKTVTVQQNKVGLALQAARSGALARRHGEIVKACDAFERAVALTPTWAIAQMELGRCYRLLGDPKGSARHHLELALKWEPKWSLVHIELGRVAEDANELELAGRYYAQAERLAAADIRAAGGAARLSPVTSPAARLVRLRRILTRQPGNIALLSELATAAEKVSAYDEAERALRTILHQSRHPKRAAARLVRFGQRTGRLETVKFGLSVLAKKSEPNKSRRK